ncbi:MAG: PKD domain-containing protein [bacterium]|jgi:PKD repeat protein
MEYKPSSGCLPPFLFAFIVFILAVAFCALALASCGKGGRLSGPERLDASAPAATSEASLNVSPALQVPVAAAPKSEDIDAIVARIRGLRAPEGANPATFDRLKNELADSILTLARELNLSKITSAAPPGDSGRVTDLAYDPETGMLSWTYVNTGDYDANGEVGVTDITPIALHYLADMSDGENDFIESWTDGDKNGEIGVGDITPIALNYMHRVEWYYVLISPTPDGPWDAVGVLRFPDFNFDSEFKIHFPLPEGTTGFAAVYPMDEVGNLGEWSAPLEIPVPENQPPVPVLRATPSQGTAPLSVELDASESSDPDGMIVKFEWDLYGTGEFEVIGDSTSWYADAVYTEIGGVRPAVRVTDDRGGTAVASAMVAVNPAGNKPPVADFGWSPQSPPVKGDVTFDASASFDADGSIVLYQWDFDGDKKMDLNTAEPIATHYYDKSSDNSEEVTLVVTDNRGALAIKERWLVFNKFPVARFDVKSRVRVEEEVEFDASDSYDEDGSIELYEWDFDGDGVYDEGPNAWPTAIHSYSEPGEYPSRLRVTDNKGAQAVSYSHDIIVAYNHLPYISLSTTLARGESPLSVSFDLAAGDYDGTVVAVQWDWENDGIFDLETGPDIELDHEYILEGDFDTLIRAVDNDAAYTERLVGIEVVDEWTRYVVASTGDVGKYASSCVLNGAPAVAYVDSTAGRLKFTTALNKDGTSWRVPAAIDMPGDASTFTSIGIVAGVASVAYCTATSGLKFVQAFNWDATMWRSPVAIPNTGTHTQDVSIEEVAGNPAAAYFDAVGRDLVYVRALDAIGSSWGEPMKLDTQYTAGEYASMKIVGGNPAIAYFGSTNAQPRYIRAMDSTGSAWNPPINVFDDWSTGGYSSHLAIISGRPAIGYLGMFGNNRYIRADDDLGESWNGSGFDGGDGSLGTNYGYTSLLDVGGAPWMAHSQMLGGYNLTLLRALDADGSVWDENLLLAGGQAEAKYISMISVAGEPGIVYYEESTGDLIYLDWNG